MSDFSFQQDSPAALVLKQFGPPVHQKPVLVSDFPRPALNQTNQSAAQCGSIENGDRPKLYISSHPGKTTATQPPYLALIQHVPKGKCGYEQQR
jgi:hypothetical protein